MYNFITLKCSNCDLVMINLPEDEIIKLNGLTFLCECCNHYNLLNNYKFEKCDFQASSSYINYIEAQISA